MSHYCGNQLKLFGVGRKFLLTRNCISNSLKNLHKKNNLFSFFLNKFTNVKIKCF